MGKKILDSKILYILISVILSVSLWFYVISLDGNEDEKTIRNIPITFAGEDILAERNLMITSSVPTATVTVKAKPSVLWKLHDDTIRLTVNVSQITEASEYTLAYTASLPSGVSQSDVQFVSGQSGNVTFTVSRYTSREVEIRGKFVGTVAEGYLAGDTDEFIFAPKTMTISGQANQVNQVDHVLVEVGGEGHSKNIMGNYKYKLIGVSGEELTDLDVKCAEETIYVTLPIYSTATIELGVDFVTGGGVAENDIRYTLSSTHITVAGTEEAIAAVAGKSITLASINLGDITEDTELVYTIPLADELINLSGVTEVTVFIDLPSDLITRTMSVTEFNYLSVPEGWTADAITQVLPVVVRGHVDLINALTVDNIRVLADLKDVSAVAGQYTVPVKIYINSTGSADDIGIMGTDFKITITLVEGVPVVIPDSFPVQ
jgi:YbbR domain-containing protein